MTLFPSTPAWNALNRIAALFRDLHESSGRNYSAADFVNDVGEILRDLGYTTEPEKDR